MSANTRADPAFRDRRVALWAVAAAGAAYLALLAWLAPGWEPHPFFGHDIYDAYFAALREGQFDLPVRLLRYEGHYAPDGTGYLYHGIGPLLSRASFGWAWPDGAGSMAGFSIWFWAVLGTACWQSVLVEACRRSGALQMRPAMVVALGAGLWVAGPGAPLVSNHALYHEPIAVGFAMAGLFSAIWVRTASGHLRLGVAVALLAGVAAVTLHARPNLAVGLYAGAGIAILWGLWRARMRFVLPAVLATALLGVGGLGYLGLNDLRFGDAAEAHGGFADAEVRYGTVFWGYERSDSPRARAFVEHGRFNVARVLPNLALYLADVPPRGPLVGFSERLIEGFRAATQDRLGLIRVEGPRMGLIYLWPLWLGLAAVGLAALSRWPAMAGLVLATALITALTLAYGTVTFRYRIDMWPVVAVCGALGAAALLARPRQRVMEMAMIALLLAGTVSTLLTATAYASQFRETPGTFFAPWTLEMCLQTAAASGFDQADAARLCRPIDGDTP